MTTLHFNHPHNRSADEVRTQLQQLADKARDRYGVESQWQDDALLFSAQGNTGTIKMLPGAVDVTIELNWLMSAMSGQIESQLQKSLTKNLG